VPGARFVQIALGVKELGWYWQVEGVNGTPCPVFDNVSLYAGSDPGPMIVAKAPDLAQSGAPAIGDIDYENLAANNILFAAGRTGTFPDELEDVTIEVAPASQISGTPRIHYKLFPNPLFDPYRTTFPPFGEGSADLVHVDGSRWAVDLPDEGFLFPGDALHYLFAVDHINGSYTITLPADTTGFGRHPNHTHTHEVPYPEAFTICGLPSLHSATPGDHPPILLWNNAHDTANDSYWDLAMHNLDFRRGVDYDVYSNLAPGGKTGSGLASRASNISLADYAIILYTSGDHHIDTISSSSADEWCDDLSLLTDWLEGGNKKLMIVGDNLAADLSTHFTAASRDFVERWLSVTYVGKDVVAGQNHRWTTAHIVPENPVFTSVDSWRPWASEGQTFDTVELFGDAVPLAYFHDDAGSPMPYPAAVLAVNGQYLSEVIYLPTALKHIRCEEADGDDLASRTKILGDVLAYFGQDGGYAPIGAPIADEFQVVSYPNPFNPTTQIRCHMPRAGHLSVKVFNLRGEWVRTLSDEVVEAGDTVLKWDGNNERDQAMPSGVYFYRVNTLGESRSAKIMLLK